MRELFWILLGAGIFFEDLDSLELFIDKEKAENRRQELDLELAEKNPGEYWKTFFSIRQVEVQA